MTNDCYPIDILPHGSRLFHDFTEMRSAASDAPIRRFYPRSPFDTAWQQGVERALQPARGELVELLTAQSKEWGAGPATLAHLEALRRGARAVVTGQQVGLFGGPLLTLLKAATVIRKAQVATAAGVPHVPIFWMATEDHDLPEVNQVTLPSAAAADPEGSGVERLTSSFPQHGTQPVGNLRLGEAILPVLARAEELLGFAPVCDLLRAVYTPDDTLASAFAKLLSGVFREQGLIVIDASTRAFHALGAPVLRSAIENADALHELLQQRSADLLEAGYHAQVLIAENSSLLFLLAENGDRLPLRRAPNATGERQWKAGSQTFTREQLLQILETEPERLSPNALLRPLFQDALLPTSAYVGGPAEVAYFAQCEPLYERILGQVTPILPRLSATLVEPVVQRVMEQHELTLRDAFQPLNGLAQKLGARAIPVEGKRRIAAAGNALDAELTEVTHWMGAMNENLGRSAEVAASKMRYQMNRLRRLAASWQLERESYLRKHAAVISHALYPEEHPQERVTASVALLAKSTVDLAAFLVEHAEQECPGHRLFAV